MAYKIAIASGKGGTGKTTVSVSLFHYLSKQFSSNVSLVDCDVEEPNAAIFLPEMEEFSKKEVFQQIPVINIDKCTFCRKCVEYCEFNAIVVIPSASFADVNSSLCHSCGACSVACNEEAITGKEISIGTIRFLKNEGSGQLIAGKLKIGSSMQTMVIRKLKKNVPKYSDLVIYDAPPGTSCPVVETIADVNYVVLVTEPTPFGLHDLKLMVQLLSEIEKPFGVIVNKAGVGNNGVYEFLESKGVELIGEIPFNKYFASNYAHGEILFNTPDEVKASFETIATNIENRIIVNEGDNYFKW